MHYAISTEVARQHNAALAGQIAGSRRVVVRSPGRILGERRWMSWRRLLARPAPPAAAGAPSR